MKSDSGIRILVTGSRGYLGSAIIDYLKEKYEVKGITEDVRNKEKLRQYFKEIDFVIHAAGKKYNVSDEIFHSVNVLGTKNVAELCVENNAKMIHLSSVARRGAYGRSKQESQKMLEEMPKLKVAILRLCPINIKGDNIRYSLNGLLKSIEWLIKENFNEKSIHLYKPER